MSRRAPTATDMVASKSKKKVLSCSTPDHTLDSPSRDSDSMCDSETASPVPFLCTQEGSDVVWNYYGNGTNSKSSGQKISTPVSKKAKKPHRLKLPEKKLHVSQPKRKGIRPAQKKTQLPPELLELNEYVDKLMEKKNKDNHVLEKPRSGSEDDIFSDVAECSPKSLFRTKKCLRKNVLSSRFNKPESESGLESDDSINECLILASQAAEENILSKFSSKRPCFESIGNNLNDFKMNDDSMDALLKSIKSPHVNKLKCDSPGLKNDSFDILVGGLNDSVLERLSQMPVMDSKSKCVEKRKGRNSNWKVEEVVIHDASPASRFSFIRHSSMPESPSVSAAGKSDTSNAIALGRFNSMPFNDSSENNEGNSPIRCTPLEIQKKRQQAREKLHAKRLLPFTQTQQTSNSLPSQATQLTQATETVKKPKFQMKFPTSTVVSPKKEEFNNKPVLSTVKPLIPPSMDLRSLIEKKRQEALMKLRRRQLQK